MNGHHLLFIVYSIISTIILVTKSLIKTIIWRHFLSIAELFAINFYGRKTIPLLLFEIVVL